MREHRVKVVVLENGRVVVDPFLRAVPESEWDAREVILPCP